MKRPIASLFLLPLAGFVLGWWVRDTSASRFDHDLESGAPAVPQRTGVQAKSDPLPGKRPRAVEEGLSETDQRREAEDRRRMRATCQRQLEIKVEEWGRLLDLADGEVQALRSAIGPAMERLDPPVAELALPALEEALKSMLEGDRYIAFQQLEIRRRDALSRAKVEARLAEMSAVILLDQAQQQSIRQNLSQDVESLPDPSSRMKPGLSPGALAEINLRLAAMNDDGSGFMDTAGAVVRERIESDLDKLAEILSADQLETYRHHLEEMHASWLPPSP